MQTFAQTLLAGKKIVYGGDPLADHTLISFLDRFMSKKPKVGKITEGKAHSVHAGRGRIASKDTTQNLSMEEFGEMPVSEVCHACYTRLPHTRIPAFTRRHVAYLDIALGACTPPCRVSLILSSKLSA